MMHQASIIFSFIVLVMGGVWLAMVQLGGNDPEVSDPPAMVAMADVGAFTS